MSRDELREKEIRAEEMRQEHFNHKIEIKIK